MEKNRNGERQKVCIVPPATAPGDKKRTTEDRYKPPVGLFKPARYRKIIRWECWIYAD
jgi:hypothetical protein